MSGMISLGVLILAAATTTSQPSIQSLKQQEYARQLHDKSVLPVVGPMNIADAVQITRHGNLLAAYSPVKSADDFVRVDLKNPAEFATLRIYKPQAPIGRQGIQFTLDDFSDPAIVYSQTEVLAPPGQLQIVGSWELADRERFVTLLERYASSDDEGREVPSQISLRVQEVSDTITDSLNLHIDAPDLATLQREHPNEIETYVRPIFAELHAQSLLSIDPHVAWQIFGSKAQPDPTVVAHVRQLLPQLDVESFNQRQEAAARLTNLGTPGAIALMHVDRNSLSPEQIARVDEILKPYHQLSSQDADKLLHQKEFLENCLSSDDPQLRQLAQRQLGINRTNPATQREIGR